MAKLTIEGLHKLRGEVKKSQSLKKQRSKARITIHMGTCGIASGAKEVMDSLLKTIEEKGITDIIVTTSGCAGLCSHEPMVTVEYMDTAPVKYVKVDPKQIKDILISHAMQGKIVQDCVLAVGSEKMS